MRITVPDSKLLRGLRSFRERSASVAVQAAADALDVTLPFAFNEEQAGRELGLYLAVWKVSHPGADIVLAPRETTIR